MVSLFQTNSGESSYRIFRRKTLKNTQSLRPTKMWNEYNVFFKKNTFENMSILYINKTIYLICIRHSTTKQDNLLYINKTIYYMNIRKRHATYVPAGALIFLQNSICVFSAPARGGPGRPRGGQGARSGRGPAGEGKVWFRVHETILWNTPPDPADPAEAT